MTSSTLRERIGRLPELPVSALEVAGKMDYSSRLPVVTFRPQKCSAQPTNDRPKSTLPKEKKCVVFRTTYWIQVTYPSVVCHYPWDENSDLAVSFDEGEMPKVSKPVTQILPIAKMQRFYKLSNLKGKAFQNPLWCSVTYGPWIAEVIEQEQCEDVPSNWTFNILGGPELQVQWSGLWSDMPSVPFLQIFGDLTRHSSDADCCYPCTMCYATNACTHEGVPCGNQLPT